MLTLIQNANVVGYDEILSNASILIRDGAIERVDATEYLTEPDAEVVDAAGAWVIPGIIDTHNDSLETEINPRPSVELPREFALGNYERRALSTGVTSSFHAISFANIVSKGRTIERSVEHARLAVTSPNTLIDHQILHRCDVWTPEGVGPIFESLSSCSVRAVSINDHMPGQGQFRDLEKFKEWIRAYRSDESFDADAEIERRMQRIDRERETVQRVYNDIAERNRNRDTILVSHDDDSPEKVDRMVELGATVAEFPITFESSSRARERGMWITVGAPNVVRGGSTSNNISARDLVERNEADIICGDYHTPSLLLSAFVLVTQGYLALPAAIRMLTANPADAFDMVDRGRIEPGRVADLVVIDEIAGSPSVRMTMRGGRPVFSVDRPVLQLT
ncbi:MAG: alpha-D-ribose 1-methylphosphonate 5-triphosphate diphosphatase [Sphaerobacteraceae bacterium]|nr:MAG: alpha-D-ribose 1-methylphosphonate 5-triphosphate diphosphatase [Sphaerobacteraceae bacterium]